MIKDLKELEKLNMTMQEELQVDLILQSLTSLYGQFIVNYHMNKIDCILTELLNILVTTEEILKSSKGIVLIMEWSSTFKRKSTQKQMKSMKKQRSKNKPKKEASKKTTNKRKYFRYNVDGH